uniref:Uncharacterized protein n=1 Tax=Terrapene triunguis TaxID=2587831 RepID=A0A674IYM9_9SAUR
VTRCPDFIGTVPILGSFSYIGFYYPPTPCPDFSHLLSGHPIMPDSRPSQRAGIMGEDSPPGGQTAPAPGWGRPAPASSQASPFPHPQLRAGEQLTGTGSEVAVHARPQGGGVTTVKR